MKKLFYLSCLQFFSMPFIYGQDSTVTISKSKYLFQDISIGCFKTDLRSVNASLKNFGYRPIRDAFIALSICNSYTSKRFLIGTEFTYLLPNKVKQADNITTRFSSFTFGARFGYRVIHNQNWTLYPYIGLFSCYSKLKFLDNAPVSNMNEVINTPHRSSEILFGNAVFDIGLQIEKLFETGNGEWDCPQINRWLTVGARIGYNFGIPTKGGYNKEAISDAPSYRMQGPYLKLVFGSGAKLRDLRWKK